MRVFIVKPEPSLEVPLKESELPAFIKSKAEKQDPNETALHIETPDPIFKKFLKLTPDPISTNSMIDKDAPIAILPYMLMALPARKRFLNDKLEPIVVKSITEIS